MAIRPPADHAIATMEAQGPVIGPPAMLDEVASPGGIPHAVDPARSVVYSVPPIAVSAPVHPLRPGVGVREPPAAPDHRPRGEHPCARSVLGAAQMGPIQRADSREEVVARMIALLDGARAEGCTLMVFPELALTTFFPRWWMEDGAEVDAWFEREMPNSATAPLFDRAREHGVAISFGYAELTPEGRRFNTQILTDRQARIVGRYRKVHLPGHSERVPARSFQHLEKGRAAERSGKVP